MFKDFYEMKRNPFTRDIPTADLYESVHVKNAIGRLAYAADQQLFAVVTADAGCGKSTLIRNFVTSMPKDEYIFLYLSDSKLTPRWFYKGMLDQLGIESRFYRGDAKDSFRKKSKLSEVSRTKKWYAYWMKLICYK